MPSVRDPWTQVSRVQKTPKKTKHSKAIDSELTANNCTASKLRQQIKIQQQTRLPNLWQNRSLCTWLLLQEPSHVSLPKCSKYPTIYGREQTRTSVNKMQYVTLQFRCYEYFGLLETTQNRVPSQKPNWDVFSQPTQQPSSKNYSPQKSGYKLLTAVWTSTETSSSPFHH